MVNDEVLHRFRLRLFSLAKELGNVRAVCRTMGVHPSTYYRWREPVLRSGLEMLRPRERRPPRMPNQLSQLVETRIVAFSLGHPGLGPRRVASTLAQERWDGLAVSPNGVWRVLCAGRAYPAASTAYRSWRATLHRVSPRARQSRRNAISRSTTAQVSSSA